MGKDLKGKELGVGISQRKDGLYTARFTDRRGRRRQKYFLKLQECRKWLAEAQYNDEHGSIAALGNMTVDTWFEYWIKEIKESNTKENTRISYKSQYNNHIKENIGDMLLNDVKPMHCQKIFNSLSKTHRNSTIEHIRLLLHEMLESAVENELLIKNPVKKTVKCTSAKKSKPKRVLTKAEQKKFLEKMKDERYYNQYAFLLQTGLRAGEMIGLTWDDIDFENKVLYVQRTMEYKYDLKKWVTGAPKSESGTRKIPLTEEAVLILKKQKEVNKLLKVIPMDFSDLIFLSPKGEPVKNSTYDEDIYRICRKTGIEKFSMHTLRHTFATRCIEAGMKPKTLQMILGHYDIGITMNLYVHVTDEEKVKEVESIEKMLKIV